MTILPIIAGAAPTHPRGWAWRPLTSVAELVTGHTPDRKRPDYWNGGLSWVNLNEIRKLDGRVCCETELQISPAGVANSSAVVHPAGTVCLSRTASVGFVTIMGAPMATSQDFVNWICGPELHPKYLMAALRASRPNILGMCSGSTHKTMYVRQAERMQVLLPPLEEQRRIVAILDKADALRAKRRAALEQLDALTQAIFLDMFGDPARNPLGWPVKPLGELGLVATGGTPSRDHAEYFDGSIPWVKTTEVDGGTIRTTAEHISEQALLDSNCRVFPEGSVVIAMYGQGATRGRASMLGLSAATNQACAVVVTGEFVEPTFLHTVLRLDYDRLRALGRGGNQANLNLTLVRGFHVPVPPRDAQKEFVSARARVEAARNTAAEAVDELEALRASLADRAFSGSL